MTFTRLRTGVLSSGNLHSLRRTSAEDLLPKGNIGGLHVAVGFMPAFKHNSRILLAVFERGHKTHRYVLKPTLFHHSGPPPWIRSSPDALASARSPPNRALG